MSVRPVRLENEEGVYQASRGQVLEAGRRLADGEVTLDEMEEAVYGTLTAGERLIGEIVIAYASEVVAFEEDAR